MTHYQYIRIRHFVGYCSAAACGSGIITLYGNADYVVPVGEIPTAYVQTGIGSRRRHIVWHKPPCQIVELGSVVAPKPGMNEFALQQLYGKAAVFDLTVGLGQLSIVTTEIEEESDQRYQNQQTDGNGYHQL